MWAGESNLMFVCAYTIIRIKLIPRTGSHQQDRMNRRRRETFWIETLNSLDPTGINKKCSDPVLESG